MRYKYYFDKYLRALQFIITGDASVVIIGDRAVELAKRLRRTRGLTVDGFSDLDELKGKRKYDFVVLNGVLGKTDDVMGVLGKLRLICNTSTRVIIYQHNHLWQWMLTMLEILGVKRKEGMYNWLSVEDVKAYMSASGYEVTKIHRRTLVPVNFFGLGKIINFFCVIFPFFDFLKLDQFLIARVIQHEKKQDLSLTICITVRNEKNNIEPIIKSLPKVTKVQEILFVEGHSTDGTREEIIRVSKKYPKKNIRVIGQPGKGQGDAIRVGFFEAKGEAIVLYEGDGTSDANDVFYFYDAINKGTAEFIEGSRFVYPLNQKTMPLFKQLGNMFFAIWFTLFLGQRTTDVLSGIKAIRRDLYMKFYKDWGFLKIEDPFGDFELLFGAAKLGLKFGEIPMRYYPRSYGQPKTSIFSHGPLLIRMALAGHIYFRG